MAQGVLEEWWNIPPNERGPSLRWGLAAYFFDFRFAFLAFFAFFAFFAISISNGLRKRIEIIQAVVVSPKGFHQKSTA
jgi:hypothetical protein